MRINDKIIILGAPGSGKSTFAKELHKITGIPLFHLDNIWWNLDRTHITRDEFDHKLDRIMQTECWILDGDYSRTYEMRIKACDTVIFLDFDTDECLSGITERVGKKRTDIPWTENVLDPELVDLVLNYKSKNRPVIYELINKYSEKEIIIFNTRKQAYEWLETISEGTRK